MNKITEYIKKNKTTTFIIAAVLLVFILMISFWVKHGTYAIDTSNGKVSINCPNTAKADSNITCDINIEIANKTILSVNANYEFSNPIQYVSFSDNNCDGNNCFENLVATENGFAVVNTEGVTQNSLVGKVTFKILATAEVGKNYTIGLKKLELSDNNFEMIELDPVYATINIIDDSGDNPGDNPDDNIIFIGDLLVDEENRIIKRIVDGTTYSVIKSKINSNATINIISNKGDQITDEDIVKTNDRIEISLNGNTVTYSLSVLGDLTGDGIIKVNDVGKLYRHQKGRDIITDQTILESANIIDDGIIKVNDVGRLYRYEKKRESSLEVTK